MASIGNDQGRHDEWAREEIGVLIADYEQRHKEITVRSRWENYNFIIVVTSLAAVGGLYLAIMPAGQGQSTGTPDFVASVAALGALIFSVLPINLAHIASSTEARRHYIEVRLEPRIRELIREHRPGSTQPLLTFEEWDRTEHRGTYNAMLVTRATFSFVPTLCLVVIYALFFFPDDLAPARLLWVGVLNIVCVALAIAAAAVAIVTLAAMWRRTRLLRASHRADEMDERWRSPRQRRRDARADRRKSTRSGPSVDVTETQ